METYKRLNAERAHTYIHIRQDNLESSDTLPGAQVGQYPTPCASGIRVKVDLIMVLPRCTQHDGPSEWPLASRICTGQS